VLGCPPLWQDAIEARRDTRELFLTSFRISLSSIVDCWNMHGWEVANAGERRIYGGKLR
jgi:hypothetical protein